MLQEQALMRGLERVGGELLSTTATEVEGFLRGLGLVVGGRPSISQALIHLAGPSCQSTTLIPFGPLRKAMSWKFSAVDASIICGSVIV